MNAKIAIKSESIIPLEDIFYVMEEFAHFGISTMIDYILCLRHCSCSKKQPYILR